MSTSTGRTTTSTSARTRLQVAAQWLDNYTLWAMNPTPTPTPRDARFIDQWSRSTDEDQLAREMAR